MFNYLKDEIKKMEGNVLSIGISDTLIEQLKKNKVIEAYDISRSKDVSFFSRKKRRLNGGKNINIKRLTKYFNKKSIDYIICDYKQIQSYYKYIFRDSIKLNRGKIYFYADKDIDMDYILKYKRYNSKIDIKEYKDTKLIIVDNKESKSNMFLNIIYYISDTVCNIIDFISNVMVG